MVFRRNTEPVDVIYALLLEPEWFWYIEIIPETSIRLIHHIRVKIASHQGFVHHRPFDFPFMDQYPRAAPLEEPIGRYIGPYSDMKRLRSFRRGLEAIPFQVRTPPVNVCHRTRIAADPVIRGNGHAIIY